MSSTLDWHSAANSQYTSLSLCHRECGKWAAGLLVTRTVLAQTYLSVCFFNLTSSFNWNYILLFYLVFCVSGWRERATFYAGHQTKKYYFISSPLDYLRLFERAEADPEDARREQNTRVGRAPTLGPKVRTNLRVRMWWDWAQVCTCIGPLAVAKECDQLITSSFLVEQVQVPLIYDFTLT